MYFLVVYLFPFVKIIKIIINSCIYHPISVYQFNNIVNNRKIKQVVDNVSFQPLGVRSVDFSVYSHTRDFCIELLNVGILLGVLTLQYILIDDFGFENWCNMLQLRLMSRRMTYVLASHPPTPKVFVHFWLIVAIHELICNIKGTMVKKVESLCQEFSSHIHRYVQLGIIKRYLARLLDGFQCSPVAEWAGVKCSFSRCTERWLMDGIRPLLQSLAWRSLPDLSLQPVTTIDLKNSRLIKHTNRHAFLIPKSLGNVQFAWASRRGIPARFTPEHKIMKMKYEATI